MSNKFTCIVRGIDLLGNPVKIIEGIGTGVFELINEPRKGLLKGPIQFGKGIKKGAVSLVSNVVGGTVGGVSKITGSLLNATKGLSNLGDDQNKEIDKRIQKPKGLLTGTISGLGKGITELATGLTGIVAKPVEQTKKDGAIGFFRGLGSGLVGAVLAPVNTVLTVGNSITEGLSTDLKSVGSNGKGLERFRTPRILYKYLPIDVYNEEEEKKKQKIRADKKKKIEIIKMEDFEISLSNEKLYLENSTKMLLIDKLMDGNQMIFTNILFKVMKPDYKEMLTKIYVSDIDNLILSTETKGKKEQQYNVKLILKNEKSMIIRFKTEDSQLKFKNGIINLQDIFS